MTPLVLRGMDDLREDFEVFLIECPHLKLLSLNSSEWCRECNEWVEGRDVGQLAIRVASDGAIEAWGSGYIGEDEP